MAAAREAGVLFLDSRRPLPAADALYGYAILEDALVVGTEGLASFRAARPAAAFDPREGRFAAVLAREDALVIRTDRTGQETLFVHGEGDDWAVATSLAVLVAERAAERRLALYPPGVQVFHIRGGRHLGEQPLSHRTMIEGVRILPATDEIHVDRTTRRMRVVARDPPLGDTGFLAGFDYEAELAHFLARSAGLLAALAEQATRLRTQLSAGYDSRMVLALLLAGGTPPDAFAVQSHRDRPGEFAVAEAICGTFGLAMDDPLPEDRILGDDEALALWEMSCLGTYLHLRPAERARPVPFGSLGLTGDLAASWKFFAGRGMLNGDATRIAQGIATALGDRPHAGAVVEDFLATFDEAGIDPGAPWAMDLFYALTRARFHCGRHWFRDLGANRLVTPLTATALMRLDVHAADRGWDRRKVVCDILSAACPALLEPPFDRPEKAFPDELRAAAPFRGALPLAPQPFAIFAGETGPPDPDTAFRQRRLAGHPDGTGAAFRTRFERIDPRRLAPWFDARDLAAARAGLDATPPNPARALHIYFVASLLDLFEDHPAAPDREGT